MAKGNFSENMTDMLVRHNENDNLEKEQIKEDVTSNITSSLLSSKNKTSFSNEENKLNYNIPTNNTYSEAQLRSPGRKVGVTKPLSNSNYGSKTSRITFYPSLELDAKIKQLGAAYFGSANKYIIHCIKEDLEKNELFYHSKLNK